MIENIYKGKKLLTCDNCGGGQKFDSWDDTLECMRAESWLIRRIDGEWTHYCPECQEGMKC